MFLLLYVTRLSEVQEYPCSTGEVQRVEWVYDEDGEAWRNSTLTIWNQVPTVRLDLEHPGGQFLVLMAFITPEKFTCSWFCWFLLVRPGSAGLVLVMF